LIPLAAIFGYVVGDICEHLLEKIWSILVARSLETRLRTGAMWLDEIGRQSGWNFFRLLGMRMRGILLESWCVVEWGVQASFYRPREGERGHE
jgi:hypothetical protein